MKILIVASMYHPYFGGGAELVVRNQAETLAARGHEVTVLTLDHPGTGVQESDLGGVRVVRVGLHNVYFHGERQRNPLVRQLWHLRDIYNRRMGRIAAAQARRIAPDIVVCHNLPGWSAAAWPALAATGLPLVQVLHDQYARCVRSNMFKGERCETRCTSCVLMRAPHRRLSRHPTAVVGVSRFVVQSLVDDGYFAGVPIQHHIRNVSHLDTRGALVPPLSGPEIVFGFIGSVNRSKGVEILLDAFAAAAQPHWRLLVAGVADAGYVESLQSSHPDPRVSFLGPQEASAFYRRIDACVVPSLWEDTLPSVVFESRLHGRPVVGADRGGIPEMITPGVDGLLFEPGSVADLARAMRAIAADMPHWRARAADIQRAAAAEYCDRERWAERWEALLNETVRRHAAGARQDNANQVEAP